MRAAVIVNAKAGSLQGKAPEDIVAEIRDMFAGTPIEAEIVALEGDAMTAAIETAAESGVECLIVGGGDGSVAFAGSRLVGKATALGILPLGTLNLVARDLHIPLDLKGAVAALAGGEIRTIDAASVNGRHFFSNAGIGFFARMARAREAERKERRFGKWHAFVLALMRAVREAHRFDVAIDLGEGPRHCLTRAVLVTNNAFDPATLLRKDRLDGGRLGVHVARHRARTDLWRTFLRLFTGTWREDPDVEVMESATVTIAGRGHRAVDISADGETWRERFPLRFEIHPGALRVLAPIPVPPEKDKADK